MTEESAVKVCVRVRPHVEREERGLLEDTEPVQLYWKADNKSIHQIDDGNSNKNFSFDRVFSAEETTGQLYQTIAKPLVVSAVEGYNGTIFAYGQTSSGKTFTMMGCDRIPGVIPLAVEDVFQTIKNFPNKEFLLRVSYMEIYNETVTDLLVDSWKRKPLEVRETINKNIYVADLTEELVTSPAQALAWIRKGEKNRHYGKTKMNQRSSRSHTIFRMILESLEKSDPTSGENADGAIIVSHLNLVDLAGSERASQTGAEGARFKEGCNINRSLFILGQVIKKLTDESQKGFINYRDSKLTRILQNSLGGNAKTLIICTITPSTLDETLSTLQFASTAKKMKNDPHVTEVSDDGALLKRYRNEIEDLKRRLHEVSSVTQTTATEKEVLSQLLQEKDQLQREQEDRIRNLTKLLVTGSNLVPVQKMPKRRVTWGGKILRRACPSTCDDDMSDLSFVDPFSLRRKANSSCLMEQTGDEYFDSHWVISEEPSDDMEMSQSSVTVRSFGDSSRDFLSPERMCELSQKVSKLELQLEMDSQQKEEAMKNVEALDGKVAELQLKLQTEAQEKLEASMKAQITEQKVAELEMLLQTEAQEKLEVSMKAQITEQKVAELEMLLQTEAQEKLEVSMKAQITEQKVAELEMLLQTEAQEKLEVSMKAQITEQKVAELEMLLQTEAQEKLEVSMKAQITEQKVAELEMLLQTEAQEKPDTIKRLESRVAGLERQLEEQSCSETEQIRREFAETIQLCETLASEKEIVVAERDYLKQELGMFIEQTKNLEQEKSALSQELKERRDLDEFKSLEEEFAKEHESELKNEISNLRKAHESSELRCQEFQSKVETLSEELKKKTELAEELQRMSGKDLVQELAMLHRSLEDAEGVSRDTKKEWAVLRSQNNDLEEMNVALTANLEKVQAEMTSLLSQLEIEKYRYRKMETDLQKELNIAFHENTKLTSLLDGKVPQNLTDSVKLERTVASLSQELKTSQEAEEALRAQLEELKSLQTQPDKVHSLTKQICDVTEKLEAVKSQRDSLLSAQSQCQLEAQRLRDVLQTSQDEILKIQAKLSASCQREEEISQRFADASQQLDLLRSDLQQSDAERRRFTALLEERDKKATESELLLESLQHEVQEQKQKNSDLVNVLEQKSESVEHSLSQQKEAERMLSVDSPDDVEKLLSTVASLTAERDQLKLDLQENVELMIENQEELRKSLEKNREQTKQIKLLSVQASKLDEPDDISLQLEELKANIKTQTAELQSVQAERDCLLSEKMAGSQSTTEEMETLLCKVASLSEERNQLQEMLEILKREKQQLTAELDETMETLQTEMKAVTEKLHLTETQRDSLLSEREAYSQCSAEESEKLLCRVASLSTERDQLQEIVEGLRLEKKQLREEFEEKIEMLSLTQPAQTDVASGLQEDHEKLTQLQQEQVAQLQDTLLVVMEQKNQVEADLQHSREMTTENENLQKQLHQQNESHADMERISQAEKAQLQQQLAETKCLLQSLQDELQEQRQTKTDLLKLNEQKELDFEQQMKTLSEELENAQVQNRVLMLEIDAARQISSEEEKLLCRVTSLTEERDQLQEILQGLREEKQQLRAELEERLETVQAEISDLVKKLEVVEAERNSLLCEKEMEKQTYSDKMEKLLCRVTVLNKERDQLQEMLEELRRDKEHLRAQLEDRMLTLQNELKTLTEQLHCTETERDRLLSLNETNTQSSTEEKDLLLSKVMSLGEEKDQLLETLEELSQEKQQLREELEERKEMISAIQEKTSQQKQTEKGGDVELQDELLNEARVTISALKEQPVAAGQSSNDVQETVWLQLQDSTGHFQESLGKFCQFINNCRRYKSPLLREKWSWKHTYMNSCPKPTVEAYDAVCQLGMQTVQSLIRILEQLQLQPVDYRSIFEELVEKDLAIFEERRLQDLLLCRVQAPTYSVKNEDFHSLWKFRLKELLDKRQLYLLQMDGILEKLTDNMASYLAELKAEISEREKFQEELLAVFTSQPASFSVLESVLHRELDRRSTVSESKRMLLQSIDGQSGQLEELKQLAVQAKSQLREEKHKTSTLLEVVEGVPLKAEVSLLVQHLSLQLQQTEENIKALHVQIKELEEAQTNANNRVSIHKQATQLLQTELQDSRALIEQKEATIQTLKSSLQDSEIQASPSAAEMEKVKNQLLKMEMKLSSASHEHEQEKHRMATLLREKEESLRKLKETLRRSHRQGEESFLQGKDVHARLTKPRGVMTESSILLEKTKLEEEVKQLQLKIIELESLVSSQQAEISKWKNRAINLKIKSKAEVEKPSSPHTPTKRGLAMTSDSVHLHSPPKKFLTPKKILDSPKKVLESPVKLLNSPKVSLLGSKKNRFFDLGGSSEVLSRTCPKQFFDNSSLGIIPDAAVGADPKEELWPLSPKQEEMCKNQ
ncbi:centromere-associated protein E isoform X3 [Melanotaenia boesemani]|uniref:centromere-associated protein E isoform X3 n=1 Tax=Melanotaenia boesemani TaxID=1250792 RepID=UPI001C048E9E|nr:centromere-associated protein E isoform X3 [Melanotaenia boesemani]